MALDELESFVKTMEHLLQDTQERLVYRCNIYIQTNILDYTPASGDLAYPEKLEMMKVEFTRIHSLFCLTFFIFIGLCRQSLKTCLLTVLKKNDRYAIDLIRSARLFLQFPISALFKEPTWLNLEKFQVVCYLFLSPYNLIVYTVFRLSC